MKKIRRIIKYSLEGCTSTRRIADRVGISHTQVSTFLGRLSGSEYSFEELIELDDKALSEIAYPWKAGKQKPKKPMPDFEKIDKELNGRKKNGVTRTLLWLEYIAENPNGYSLSRSMSITVVTSSQRSVPCPRTGFLERECLPTIPA